MLQDEDGNDIDTLAVTITIVGANDAPTIIGALTGMVTEDGNEVMTTATGMLTVTDVDSADPATDFEAQADVPGTYGSFTLTEDGAWTYALENADPATNALAAGVTRSDVFTVVFDADNSVTQAVTITVTGANDAPTAVAEPLNQPVPEGVMVRLDGTGSHDPDMGDTLTYTWTQIGTPTVTLTNADSATATFTAPNLTAPTDLTFTLTVTDSQLTATDTVIINIDADNDAAVIGGMNSGTVTEDAVMDTATGTLTAMDPDDPDNTFAPMPNTAGAPMPNTAGTYGIFTLFAGGDWTYTLDNTPGDDRGDATNALAEGDAMEDVFTARSIDGTQATVTITVSGANDAPTADAGPDQSVDEGAPVTLTGADSSDPDMGDSLTYAWTQSGGTPTVTLADAATVMATFTAPEFTANMDLTFTLTITDSSGEMATDTVTITVQADDDPAVIGGVLTAGSLKMMTRTRFRAC